MYEELKLVDIDLDIEVVRESIEKIKKHLFLYEEANYMDKDHDPLSYKLAQMNLINDQAKLIQKLTENS